MTDIEKLRALLPHWIEHNQEHGSEFLRWAEKAASAGHGEAAGLIRSAAQAMEGANAALQQALDKLGGPIHTEHSHTH
jgi:hypothetical protein